MRLVPINSVREGTYLAKSIYNNNGRVLLNEGVQLTTNLIGKVKEIGIYTLYIHDGYSDAFIEDMIEPQLRQTAINTVKNSFQGLEKLAAKGKNPNNIATDGNYLKSITEVAESIMNEIMSRKNILINLVDIKSLDNYTYQHSVNVTVISMILGMQLKLTKFELYILCVGAMLHDIGKVFIDPEIVQKNGPLTDKEFDEIKLHTTKGYDYLKGNLEISPVARIISLQHHERPDGKGYPEKKKAEDIHKLTKIVSIADVYDALTSYRTYREALSPSEALEYIMANGGSQFDYEMVKVFSKTVVPYPEGTLVKLSTGDIAVVEEVNVEYALRPKLKIIKGKNEGSQLDLEKELSIVISGVQYDTP